MITLTVKSSNADKATIRVESVQISVLELKQAIVTQTSFAQSPAEQRLVFKGRVMKDDVLLEAYGINDNDTVYFVKTATAARSESSAAADSAPPRAAPAPAPVTNPWGSSPAPAPGGSGSPFMGFPGMGMGMGMGSPLDMAEMQRQLSENPEMMQNLMNSPMMESLFNDPELIRQMMESNPQMQAMMRSNPQMAQVLRDPSVMRQAMEMMRNPLAMQEAMRQQDRAFSQLESMPGGHSALRRLYEEVQEPMMDAMSESSAAASRTTSTPAEPPRSTPSTTAIPNPWGVAATSSTPRAGAPGLGFPGMGAMGAMGGMGAMGAMGGMGGMGGMGAPSDMAHMNAMMQNPAMRQMVQQAVRNPAMLDMAARSNPQLAAALRDPAMRAMLSNPDLYTPDTMSAMSHLQSVFNARGGGMGPGGGGGIFPPPAGRLGAGVPSSSTLPAGLQGVDFSAFLGGGSGFGSNLAPRTPAAATPPAAAPAVTYAAQNQQLRDMGFTDDAENLVALQATQGNVNAAVERLLR